LVETVTEGGRASRRRRMMLLGVAGVMVAGGGVVAVTQLATSAPGPIDAARVAMADAVLADAAPLLVDVALEVTDTRAPDDAAPIAIDGRIALADAREVRDAVTRKLDAAIVEDAAMAVAIDAAVAPVDAAPVVAETGTLIISNDTWCDVTVDGIVRGRLANASAKIVVKLPAGSHSVICEQPGINRWAKDIPIEAGKTVAYGGNLLASVEVTIAIAADRVLIEGTYYPRGAKIKLKPGRKRGVVFHGDQGGVGGFFDIPRVACRLHEVAGGLVCDP
jgi:hypothetical protein